MYPFKHIHTVVTLTDCSMSNPKRVIIPFTDEEAIEIQQRLDTKLDASHLSYRPAAQGTVAYLEGWKSFNLANEVFGFNGWSSEILNLTTDFTDVDANGKISLGMSCMVRVHLKDGTYHDDIGYGSSENQKSKGAAFEKAKKEAVTDAMKRALRIFGNRLGNCAYDKAFLKDVKIGKGGGCLNLVRSANYPKVSSENMNPNAIMEYQKIKNQPYLDFGNQTTNPSFLNQNHNSAPELQLQSQPQPRLQPRPYSVETNKINSDYVNVNNPPHIQLQKVQALAYDESIFDNSMMISEEDLIVDENFLNVEEVNGVESELLMNASTNLNNDIYPILSRNRNQ